MNDGLKLLDLFSDLSTPLWIALSGLVSGIGAWIVSLKRIDASIERARLKMISELSSAETVDRATFRSNLMTEISALRELCKACEAEKDILRGRVSRSESQMAVLKASNEIMERWLTFFRDRNASGNAGALPHAPPDDDAGR